MPIGMASPRGGWGRIHRTRIHGQQSHGVDDANEAGAGGVYIVLDGRFSTQTDAAGLYHFDDVATGPHTIVVQPDALPLPWHFAAPADHRLNWQARSAQLSQSTLGEHPSC